MTAQAPVAGPGAAWRPVAETRDGRRPASTSWRPAWCCWSRGSWLLSRGICQAAGAATVLLVVAVLLLIVSRAGAARPDAGGGRGRRGSCSCSAGTAAPSATPACTGSTRSPARRKVSTRIRNHEIGAGQGQRRRRQPDRDRRRGRLAGRRHRPARLYSVDDYTQFVAIQTETAVRHIASSYPYTSRGDGELSLRDNADEITSGCPAEIADAGRAGRGAHHRVAADPAVVRRRDRPGHAAPAAGQRRGRRAAADRGGRGRHGPAGPAAARRTRTSSSWMRSARPPWCPTCWWCCAASRPPSRSSTPAPCTSDGSAR